VVYFSSKEKPGFNIAQTVSFPMQHDGQPHDYEAKLPVETLTALRLDPGNAPGEITVTTLELRDTNGAVVKSWLTANPTGSSPRTDPVDSRKAPTGKGKGKAASAPSASAAAPPLDVRWFNPRTGETTAIGKLAPAGEREFTPPTFGDGHDWVLVLDSSPETL
jgi:hypothetical protein